MAVSTAVLPTIEKKGLYRILEEISMGKSVESSIGYDNSKTFLIDVIRTVRTSAPNSLLIVHL